MLSFLFLLIGIVIGYEIRDRLGNVGQEVKRAIWDDTKENGE